MSYARQLLDTYPGTVNVDAGVLAAAIDALSDCAQACIADVDADLSEQNVTEMVTCIRLCLDCADVCTATIGVTSRQASYDINVAKPLLEACVAICNSCATSAGGTPRCTSTAGSASRPAGAASRPAASSWPPWNRRTAAGPAQLQLAADHGRHGAEAARHNDHSGASSMPDGEAPGACIAHHL